jgi:general secretion pathway protein C
MAARWTASLVWAALAASLVFWALRLGAGPQAAPAGLQTVAPDQSARGDILRLFANPPTAAAPAQQVAAASRFKLLGVVAGDDTGHRGWAVISVDGQPARTFTVGASVDPNWVVQGVTPGRVSIGPAGGPAAANLDLSVPPAPATGSLPAAGANAGFSAVPNGAPPVAQAPAPADVPPPMPEPNAVAR